MMRCQPAGKKGVGPQVAALAGVPKAVIAQAIANPALGQLRASNELKQQGILISSSGVRSIWLRNDLETMRKRLKALEAKSAQDGIVLKEYPKLFKMKISSKEN